MAGGGQKGIGGIEFASGAMIVLGFIGGCSVRGWMEGDEPDTARTEFEQDCEEAFYGQTDDTAILDDTRCEEHVIVVEREAEANAQTKLAEAQQDLQEAQTP